MPQSDLKPFPQHRPHTDQDPRILIVSCMKNEGPFILEWVAWHRAMGVSDFLIYTNDCDDGTDAIWTRLAALGLAEHRQNTIMRRGVQKSALYHARSEPVVAAADWHLVLDVDEFVNVTCGNGSFPALISACPEATTFAMTWRVFGDGGNISFRDGFVTEQFARAAPRMMARPPQAWGIKTLYRNDALYGRMGVHTPLDPVADRRDEIVVVNGSGRVLDDSIKDGAWRSDRSTVGYDLVQINHYAVRSIESFLVKRDRGRVNHMDHDQGLAYWTMMSHNHEPDDSIMARLGPARAEFARLMQDAELRQLHANAVQWHRDRIRALKARPDFAELFNQLVTRVAERDAPMQEAS